MWKEGVNLGVLPPKDPLEGIDVGRYESCKDSQLFEEILDKLALVNR